MNQGDSESKVEVTKSGEELNQLLGKFEQNIVGSITRGIEIADNFSRESTSSKNQTEADILNEKTDAVETNIIPKFLSINLENKRWEFLNPIILYKNNWMGAKTDGIHLEKGTYEIKYSITAKASEGSGLALFDRDTRKIVKILFWQLGAEKSESIINVSGTQHLAIYSPGIINITDINGNFNPKSIESIYIVTVFRLKTLPD